MRDNRFSTQAEEAFRHFVMRPEFPCLGAKAAVNAQTYTVRAYGELGSPEATVRLATDLSEFVQSQAQSGNEYATFAAVFSEPRPATEIEFEQLLWRQLRALREHEADKCAWDPTVSADPADPHFSFSFGGRALYVIGMHPTSSRDARRFPWPTLVFNPHVQFERLRADGKWQRMQETIRHRDRELQGTINPMLSDFGEQSEARQYSGRAVDADWQAPFKAASPGKCPFAH
jgi:FPC/CPF motif-containing protein YcgG